MTHANQLTTRHALTLIACAVLILALTAAPASAEADSGFQLELSASLLFDSDIDVEGFGLRPTYRLSDRFQVGGSLVVYQISSFDVWVLDASLRWFFDADGRSRWYLSAGPGTAFEDFDDLGDNGLLLHFGVGTEIDLTPNVYLRPEILARWSEHDFEDPAGDLSIGIGWRL